LWPLSGAVATSWYEQASRRNLRPFRSRDAPLIAEREGVAQRKVAMSASV
jgi:hypothetical protein